MGKGRKKTRKNTFKINFDLKSLNPKLLDLLNFNMAKLEQIRMVEDDVSDIQDSIADAAKPTEELKIHITNNSLFDEIEFILGPEKRKRAIRDNRILCDIMHKGIDDNTIIVGEFRGPLKTDETDDSEKNCKIIWNKEGNKILSDLSDKL